MYVLEKKNLLVSIFLKPAKVQQPETIKSKWELNPWYPIIAYGLVVLIPATLAPSYDEMKPSHWNIHPHSQDSGYNVMSITGQEFLPSCYHKHSHHHQKPEGSMRKRKKKKVNLLLLPQCYKNIYSHLQKFFPKLFTLPQNNFWWVEARKTK